MKDKKNYKLSLCYDFYKNREGVYIRPVYLKPRRKKDVK